MNEITRFRTSFAGFNRSDVAEYIERTAAEHQAKLREVEEQNVRLVEEKYALEQKVAEQQRQMDERRKELDAVRASLAQAAALASDLLHQVDQVLSDAADALPEPSEA